MTARITTEQTIEYLQLELARVRAENTRLRKAVQENSRHAERVERAYQDALLLATRHIAYQPTSRDQVQELTKRRWTNAIGLLRLARVYNHGRFTRHNLADIEAALEKARRTALETPTAYRARLPRHALDERRPGS